MRVVGRIFTPALNENSPVGTSRQSFRKSSIRTVGDVYTYSLTDDAGGAFDIQSDGTIVVLDPSLIDFENTTSLNVTVRITDPVTGFHDEVVHDQPEQLGSKVCRKTMSRSSIPTHCCICGWMNPVGQSPMTLPAATTALYTGLHSWFDGVISGNAQ